MLRTELATLLNQCRRGRLSRRQFFLRGLQLGCSLSALAVLLDYGHDASAAGELNVLGWGGLYQDALTKWVSGPFESANHVKVNFQGQGFAAQSLAKIQAERAKPTIDVWLTTTAIPLVLAKAGVLQELTLDKVPNLANIVPPAIQKYKGKSYAAGIHLNATLIVVDRQRIKSLISNYNVDMLKSWEFLYRPELKNQIGIPGFQGLYGASMIGMSKPYGGSEFEEDKFFAAMRRLAPNVHLVKTQAVGWVQPFLSKEIVACESAGTDAAAVLNAGVPVDIVAPRDPLVVGLDYIVAIKNGPAGGDIALKYINRLLQPDIMAGYCTQLGVYSANRKAVVSPPGMPSLTPDELAKGWVINYDAAVAHYDAWNERFNKEIVPLFGR
jgi:putative spermidine/putrescine transport system substrate-binding protein